MLRQSFSPARAKRIFGFALMLIFGVAFLTLTIISSAQDDYRVVNVNQTARGNSARDVPKSTVRGRIVYEDTEKPVRRMPFSLVIIQPIAVSGSTTVVTNRGPDYFGESGAGITDSNGEFEMRNVVAGKYRLRVDAPNVINDGDAESAAGAEAANVSAQLAGEFFAPPDGAVDATIRVKRGGVIGGKIVYSDGEPAVNAAVTIIRKAENGATSAASPPNKFQRILANISGYYPRGGSNVTTDDRGVYRIIGLAPGEYVVRVVERAAHAADSRGDNYTSYISSFLSWFYPNAQQISKATALRIDYGQELTDIDFTLSDRPLFKVAGRVTARGNNQPIAKARIVVRQRIEKPVETENQTENLNERSGLIAQTKEFAADEAGVFGFKDLPAGKYTAFVASPSGNEREYDDDGRPIRKSAKDSFLPAEKDFEITNTDLLDFNLELQPGAVISGTIATDNNRALPNYLSITFYDEDKKTQLNESLSAQSDESGKVIERAREEFSLVNVPAGKFGVVVYSYGSDEPNQPITYLKTVQRAGGNLTLPIEIKASESITNLQLILGTDGGTVKGVLRGKDNQLAQNKRIFAITTDASKWDNYDYYKYAGTSERGEFEFKGAPGEYAIILYSETDFDLLQKQNRQEVFAWLRARSSGAPKVSIRANQTETVNLTLP